MKNTLTVINYPVLLLLIFFFYYVECEIDNCNFGTCGQCIGFESERCVWCSQDVFNDRRCRPESFTNANKTWCKPEHLVNPQPIVSREKNQEFGKNIQFKPQLIKIKARPGIPIKFDMSFKPAKDYPLDVYYLMDISYTMRPKMDAIKEQAKEIRSELMRYTNNVKLGVGTFIDKPGFPYADPKHQSHAFRNDVPLTDDMEQFSEVINNTETGSNFDDPEAGLDALMQAMKCVDEVKWRPMARRIIVLCTDSTYHSAGDGKIVGAIKPHDMQCHLKNDTYSEALTYDYPSVSQINQVATDGRFRIIFAISPRKSYPLPKTEYEELASQIEGAKYAKMDEESVIKIIKDAYEELANTIKLKVKAPSFVDVNIDQDCESDIKRNCESPHKQIVNITGTLKVKSCPSNDYKNPTIITINPDGLNDTLVIQLEVDCKCDCENKKGVINPKVCNGEGFLQCGICKCNPGRYGDHCQCNGTSTDKTDMDKCKLNAQDKPCSRRGICRCGKCEKCEKGFSGDYCEFDDQACPKSNNKICSGEHGICRRGQCHCENEWTGADCSCPNHNRNCIAPYSNEVCSGRGTCNCGVCKCNSLEGKNETYFGTFCDSCEECAQQRCKELEDYAYCNYMHMTDKAFCDNENNGTMKEIDISFMNKTEINDPTLFMAKYCKKIIDPSNGTYMVFKYQYDKNVLKIAIQKEVETPPEPNIWVAVGSSIGLVLLIGILTVIVWKILVDLHDKKEYQKFSDEALAQGYDVSQNPLYQDPSVNFSNPVYNNQCN